MSTAWIALWLWPVVCIALYRGTTLPVAFCVSIVGGYLLLPSAVSTNLPLLPSLNKASIPTLTVLVLTFLAVGQRDQKAVVLKGWVPRNPVLLILLLMLLVGFYGTVVTNQDGFVAGPRFLRGMRLYDGFSMLMSALVMLIPFFLARKVLATPEGHRILLLTFAVSAVIYTLPALYEVRMSPQIHRMVYGFFPSSFLQAGRNGGFRPSVFLNHGLALSIFLTLALIATAGLYRASSAQMRTKWLFAVPWLLLVLVLSKSLGALLIAILLVPAVFFLSAQRQLMVAALISGLVITYPMLRAADVVPIERVATFAASINPQRAESFLFRVKHENRLLEKAQERPTFGWGIWGRARIYSKTGRDLTVVDGAWIGALGAGGWFNYISLFGFLCWPIIGLFLSRRTEIDPLCAALSLMMAAKLLDLLPNSGMEPIVWMMAGALMGRLEMREKAGEQVSQGVATPPPKPGHARKVLTPDPTQPAQYARTFNDKLSRSTPETGEKAADGRDRKPYTRGKPALGNRR